MGDGAADCGRCEGGASSGSGRPHPLPVAGGGGGGGWGLDSICFASFSGLGEGSVAGKEGRNKGRVGGVGRPVEGTLGF